MTPSKITIDPKIESIVKRLENLIPFFKECRPAGWIDFRNRELSLEWRGGTYINTERQAEMLEIKGVFGCSAAASLAASQFYAATGHEAIVEGGDGQVWSARIVMPLSEVNW